MKRKRRASVGQDFMRRTQFKFLDPTGQARGEIPPPIELPYDPSARIHELPGADTVDLAPVDLRSAIEKRKSVREFLPGPLSSGDLSFLLWATQGVREADRVETFRTVPSAGARHPFETYLAVNRVDGLSPGLYRYLALRHALLECSAAEGICEQIAGASLQPELIQSAAVTFIWVAIVGRMPDALRILAARLRRNPYRGVYRLCSVCHFKDCSMPFVRCWGRSVSPKSGQAWLPGCSRRISGTVCIRTD